MSDSPQVWAPSATSLRRRLLSWILLPLAGLIGINAWVGYGNAVQAANEAYDRSLYLAARTLAEELEWRDGRLQLDVLKAAGYLFENHTGSRLFYKVTSVGGAWLAGDAALPSAHANTVTVKSLLDYLYMDRIHIVSHKRQELASLAADLHLERLAAILSADADTAPHLTHTVASSFTENMVNLFHSPMHCDIVFVVRKAGARREWSDGQDAEVHEFATEDHEFVLYGHRVVVCSRLPYFEALLSGGFSESQNTVLVRAPFGGSVCKAVEVDVSGLVLEGIELSTFEMVLLYAYTGQLHSTGKKLPC